MALPGTPGQRISDLCNSNHITQKELAAKLAPMDEEAADLFQQLMKKMTDQVGIKQFHI